MNKREKHEAELSPLLCNYIVNGDDRAVIGYLVSNSNLPGRRANLELAWAFADLAKGCSEADADKLWSLSTNLIRVTPEEAPTNDPREFLPFCGLLAIGAIGSKFHDLHDESVSHLKNGAADPRWRMREAAAQGLQRLLQAHKTMTFDILERWIEGGDWLAMRGVAAGVAEPSLLRDPVSAMRALGLHGEILDRILVSEDRRSDEFRTLRKGLGYTLSVVVTATPEEGFALMRRLVDSGDGDILWIIRQNLKKNRLLRNFPVQTAQVVKLIN